MERREGYISGRLSGRGGTRGEREGPQEMALWFIVITIKSQTIRSISAPFLKGKPARGGHVSAI